MPQINAPADFLVALESLKGHAFRRELHVTQIPPPKKIAPWAVALQTEVNTASDLDPDFYRGSAKFVVLFDPAGQPAWDGTFRIVTYFSAPVDEEMSADPLLGEVAWAWLGESLAEENAPFSNLTGTVTRNYNETFDGSALTAMRTDVEIRASWTPKHPDLSTHLQAWARSAATICGLGPDGVASIQSVFKER